RSVSDGRIGFTQGLIIFIFLMVFITWLGGMRGVAWTDTVQGIFMLVGEWFSAVFSCDLKPPPAD
ncbi:sodium:solute symporter family transporter, partial [Acetomicrobium sp. S15 = DSM 107314]|uniref:sodium:solute symporter family transporter n=1 Tax=Acetomicrobium sp. S15 = DSM 107314 TaxID=2529858 RepID=UPI0018E19555